MAKIVIFGAGDIARLAEFYFSTDSEHDALAPLTFEQLQSFGRSRGLRWYVANTPASQLWPAAVTSRCAYCGRGIQVYDLR